jgi:Dolichyl-phosphate-mannose-protein mannosyltransferase
LGHLDPMNTELRSRPAPTTPLLLPLALLAGLTLVLVLFRLSAYGIWDPWELSVADAARKLGERDGSVPATLTVRLISASFAAFGAREWAGRLPLAVFGLLLLAITFVWVRALSDRRTALFSVAALTATPFFLLHSREMMGATPGFAGAALVMLGASLVVFGRELSPAKLWGALATAVLGAAIGSWSVGALSGLAPPLLAVAITALLTRRPAELSGTQRTLAWLVLGAAVLVLALLVQALLRHASGFSFLIGGAPNEGAIITYERSIEHLFHGFAPWSAVLPVAVAVALRAPSSSGPGLLGALCALWAAFAYAAQSIFLSSFGGISFMAPSALAVVVALWLREREESERSDLAELLIVVLMLGLVIRDFAFYPGSPFAALEIGEAKLPDVFNPKRIWSALLSVFGLALVLTAIAPTERTAPNLRAPYDALRAQWQRGNGHRAWLVVFALLAVGLLAFGIVAFSVPRVFKLTSLGIRVGKICLFIPLVVPGLVAGAQLVYHNSARLRSYRATALLGAALLVGAYTSQIFLPQLSAHLSPRGVFDTYNKLAQAGEPLAQHKVEGRAAAYYADGQVRDINGQGELIDFLAEGPRKWAAFPSDQLAELDTSFRRRTGRHLYVPALDNGKIVLAASVALPGKPDKNPLALYVKREPPAVQFPLNADFEGKVELIGYNLGLPRTDSVGLGQSFTVTWVWRAKQSGIGAYQVFLHVDSGDQRINGDHDPVDGKYPVRLWDEGDIIIDRQEVAVPATSPAGVYGLFVGLFRGESRMKITQGPHDDADRVRAGTVRVQ